MLKKEELVKKIAKRKGLDERVVRLIADFPLKFVRDKMSNPEDFRPIRLRYFGVFALKRKYWNKEKYPEYNVIKQIPLTS